MDDSAKEPLPETDVCHGDFSILNVPFQTRWIALCFTTQSITQLHQSGACFPFCDATNRDQVARLHNKLKMIKCTPPHKVLMSEWATGLRCNCLCRFGLLGQSTHVCRSRCFVFHEHCWHVAAVQDLGKETKLCDGSVSLVADTFPAWVLREREESFKISHVAESCIHVFELL